MEDHVPRHAQMGAWVLINDRWYEACGVLFLSRVAFGKLADMIGGSVWTNATAAIAVVITLIIVGSLWATINRRPLAVAG